MARFTTFKSGLAAAAMTAAIGTTALVGTLVGMPTAASAQSAKDGKVLVLSIGRGQQVNLGSNITDVVVADPNIADVEVKTGRQIYILGKGPGETTVYATDAAGRTVYQATVRVGSNMDSISHMLALAMPDSKIIVTTMNGTILLTGTVNQPEEAAEAEALVKAFTGGNTQVLTQLKNATPLQINLQVRIAEVSRSWYAIGISIARIVCRIPQRPHDARRRKSRPFARHYNGSADPFHSTNAVHRYSGTSRLLDWRRVFEIGNGAASRRPLQPTRTVCSIAPKMLWPASSRTSMRTTSPSCRNGVVISPVAIFSTMRTSAIQL